MLLLNGSRGFLQFTVWGGGGGGWGGEFLLSALWPCSSLLSSVLHSTLQEMSRQHVSASDSHLSLTSVIPQYLTEYSLN